MLLLFLNIENSELASQLVNGRCLALTASNRLVLVPKYFCYCYAALFTSTKRQLLLYFNISRLVPPLVPSDLTWVVYGWLWRAIANGRLWIGAWFKGARIGLGLDLWLLRLI